MSWTHHVSVSGVPAVVRQPCHMFRHLRLVPDPVLEVLQHRLSGEEGESGSGDRETDWETSWEVGVACSEVPEENFYRFMQLFSVSSLLLEVESDRSTDCFGETVLSNWGRSIRPLFLRVQGSVRNLRFCETATCSLWKGLLSIFAERKSILRFGPVYALRRERRERLVGEPNHRYRLLLSDFSLKIDTDDLPGRPIVLVAPIAKHEPALSQSLQFADYEQPFKAGLYFSSRAARYCHSCRYRWLTRSNRYMCAARRWTINCAYLRAVIEH